MEVGLVESRLAEFEKALKSDDDSNVISFKRKA